MAADIEGNPAAVASAERGLVRAMGTLALAAGIVNVTIGGGIFRLPAGAADALGAAAPFAYLICAAAMGLIVLCFAEAGSRVSLTGGLYAYVEVAFGPFVGFLSGALLWAGITAAIAAVSSFFADSIVALVPAGAAMRPLIVIVALAAVAWLNVLGVRGASRFNAVMTAAKLVPLLLFVVIGAFAVHRANYHIAAMPTQSSFARASVFLIFAFLGVESALVPSGEVRDPSRTVPRAIFVAMAVITLVYLAVHLVAQGILGSALAGDKTPLATAANAVMGPAGRTLVLVGSALSMFGYVSGMTLAVPRMLFAFGRDGFLPRVVASVHPRFHTPWVAIIVQTVIVAALAISGSFETLAIVANGAVLLVYAACCLAALELRRRDVRMEGALPFRVPVPGLAPVLGFAIVAWLLSHLTAGEWRAIGIVVAIAIVIYLVARFTRGRAGLAAAALVVLCAGRAHAQAAAADETPGIQDNSFLVEEAYNQEKGVVQHISTMSLTSVGSWAYTFTQEWPVGGLANQLSYTIPLFRQSAAFSGARIGDVAVNYRYQLVGSGDTRVAIAPRLTLMLASGDAALGTGAGGTSVQWNVPLSYVLAPTFVMHSNLGMTVTPRARLATGTTASLSSIAAGQSFIWLARPTFNVMLESLLTSAKAGAGDRMTSVIVSPGVRWAYNFPSKLQIVPGLAFPVTVHPGTQLGTILYLSFEHPFTRTD